MNSLVSPIRSPGLASTLSSKAVTPRASNLTGAEIYSLHSSTNLTPRESSLDHSDFCLILSNRNVGSPLLPNGVTSDQMCSHRSSRGTSPRLPSTYGEHTKTAHLFSNIGNSSLTGFPLAKQSVVPGMPMSAPRTPRDSFGMTEGNQLMMRGDSEEHSKIRNIEMFSPNALQISKRIGDAKGSSKMDTDSRELHMFVWSSSTSPISDGGKHALGGIDYANGDVSKYDYDSKDATMMVIPSNDDVAKDSRNVSEESMNHDFSFVEDGVLKKSLPLPAEARDCDHTKINSCLPMTLASKQHSSEQPGKLPPPTVMVKLILDMVWRKLIRNPNTYSSLLGIVWSLVSYRWHIGMPTIVDKSIKILSNAGLGMAMFSLGLFMALQSRILACGTSLAIFGMLVRFLTGPAVMAAASIAVGLRSTSLRASIVQAALPQGIVPFVFAKEYNVHPDILSTAVIFGMLVSLPITLVYFLLLGL
ncbi:hypothetical protein O6H91_Y245400 [Diphasiastrum complanatum]|nr:hypothetical protein O6H91_Y245400 [Diphasiastrum complanatum]